jgi:hypothetical protein
MDIITKQKTYFWLIAILIVINIVTLYFMWSQRPGPPTQRQMGKRDMKGFLFKELNLDSTQQKLFEQYRDEHFKMIDSLFNRIGEVKKAILDEAWNTNPDREKITGLTKKIGELNALVEISLFDHFAKLKSVLKEDQLKKFKEMLSESFRIGMPGGGNGANFPPPSPGMRQDFPPGNRGEGRPLMPPPGK